MEEETGRTAQQVTVEKTAGAQQVVVLSAFVGGEF